MAVYVSYSNQTVGSWARQGGIQDSADDPRGKVCFEGTFCRVWDPAGFVKIYRDKSIIPAVWLSGSGTGLCIHQSGLCGQPQKRVDDPRVRTGSHWWREQETSTQCWTNVGPASTTLAQHWSSIAWMSRDPPKCTEVTLVQHRSSASDIGPILNCDDSVCAWEAVIFDWADNQHSFPRCLIINREHTPSRTRAVCK